MHISVMQVAAYIEQNLIDVAQVQRGNALPQRDGIIIELTINLFVVMRYGPGDVMSIDEDDVEQH